MFKAFFRYFFFYLFRAKTRQKLLFFAFVGLALSSFSLLVLQSTMGGLQRNVIERSKSIFGNGEVLFQVPPALGEAQAFSNYLNDRSIAHSLEYQFEVLIRRGQQISPAIVHGVLKDSLPSFLKEKNFNEAILGAELFSKLGGLSGESIQIISPAHVNPLFRDVPRSTSVYVDSVFRGHVPEVDSFHAWVEIGAIHNLIRDRLINRIRIEGDFRKAELKDSLLRFFPKDNFELNSWYDSHQTLVWALGLETSVMVFLFIAMTILVSLCIVSGLLLFFDKVQLDLSSFWILGASRDSLESAAGRFFILLALSSVLFGLVMGFGLLMAIEIYGIEILPAVFVDRQIPVFITLKGVLVSFFIPFGIGVMFLFWVLRSFKGKVDYLERVRSVG